MSVRGKIFAVGLAVVAILAPIIGFGTWSTTRSEVARKYLAVGDSYASGEGLAPYETGTDDINRGGDGCHRSALGYPRAVDVGDLDVVFKACSGAKVSDLLGGTRPQVAEQPDDDVAFVSITIGGNDVGWISVLAACGLAVDCPTAPMPASTVSAGTPGEIETVDAFVARRLGELAGPLREAFARIAVAAPNATIVVTGYPVPLPVGTMDTTTEPACSLLATAFETGERQWLANRAVDLNILLADAATSVGLAFIDVATHFAEHGACSPSGSWINALLVGGPGRLIGPGSFHPNAEGQRQLAEVVGRAVPQRLVR